MFQEWNFLAHRLKDFLYFFKKSFSYILGNRTFQEIKLSSEKIKTFLTFLEIELSSLVSFLARKIKKKPF